MGATRPGIAGWIGVALAAVVTLSGIASAQVVAFGAPAPELASGAWINSEPLTLGGLRGRVVLLEFWTYG